MSKLDELCDRFWDEYERAAPVSRERGALWETLYLLENVLKPGRRSDRSTCREPWLSSSIISGRAACHSCDPPREARAGGVIESGQRSRRADETRVE
ncbi:MAG: hypothetical protein E6J70_05140 [Deltaproteobacteria bacterium]|nr:MAG: hypothetical protein E6J70_05140 [Deltaproteobacteria bacterium]